MSGERLRILRHHLPRPRGRPGAPAGAAAGPEGAGTRWSWPTSGPGDGAGLRPGGGLPRPGDGGPGLRALLGRLWGLVSAVKPDVLHTHLLKADSYGAVVGRFGARGPPWPPSTTTSRPSSAPGWPACTGLSRLDDRIIVCSDHVGRYMVQTDVAPAQKMRWSTTRDRPRPAPGPLCSASAGVCAATRPAPRRAFLLCVARLDPQKRAPLLDEAMRGVLERFPDARLVLVGAAAGSEEYVARCGSRRRERSWWARSPSPGAPGRPPPDGAADVFVLASLWEGFGLVFAEAMGARTPVVGTRVSAPRRWWRTARRESWSPRDPQALAEA